MPRPRFALLAALILAHLVANSLAPSAQAGLVAFYDFTGSPGDQVSEPADSAAAGITAGDIVRGPGITAGTAADSINSSAWTTATAVASNDYYGFQLTPASGATFTLTRLSFGERRSNTGIRNFEIRSSLDGFAAAIGDTFTSVPDNSDFRQRSFTLTPAFADLTTAVTFRIYGYSSESSGGTWRLSNYDGSSGGVYSGGFVVEGTVTLAAVPESGAATFAAVAASLSGLAYACRLRFGRRK